MEGRRLELVAEPVHEEHDVLWLAVGRPEDPDAVRARADRGLDDLLGGCVVGRRRAAFGRGAPCAVQQPDGAEREPGGDGGARDSQTHPHRLV